MYNNKLNLIILSLMLILGNFTNLSPIGSTEEISISKNQTLITQSYIDSDSIYVNGNAAFTTTYSLPGTGTIEDPFVIEGYNITSITVTNTDKYFKITNCYIQQQIHINNVAAETALITNNIISNNLQGIVVEGSPFTNISFNEMNTANIHVKASTSTLITNNTFTNGGLNILDSALSDIESYIVTGNTVNGKKLGYFVGENNLIKTEPKYGQLFFINSQNIFISNQDLSNSNLGIFVKNGNNITLKSNNFYKNEFSIHLDTVQNANITYNSFIQNNNNEISLFNTLNANVAHNTLSDSYGRIYVYTATNISVNNNIITNPGNPLGLYMDDTYKSLIDGNYFENNIRLVRIAGYVSTNELSNVTNNIVNEIVLRRTLSAFIYNNQVNRITTEFALNSTIISNTVNHGIIVEENSIDAYTTYNVSGNKIAGGLLGWYISKNNLSFTTNQYKQIILINSNNTQIIGLTMSGLFPFYGRFLSNFTFTNNNLVDIIDQGLVIRNSNFVNINNNRFSNLTNIETGQAFTISMRDCNNTKISSNYIDNNYDYTNWQGFHAYAVSLSSLNSLKIENNTIINTGQGIGISNSHDFQISNNRIEPSGRSVSILSSTTGIINNNIIIHSAGIYIVWSDFIIIKYNYIHTTWWNDLYGVYIDRSYNCTVYYNSIFKDHSWGSQEISYGFEDYGGDNKWYNETLSKGNFWGDYTGDGHYSIGGSMEAIDPFPLVKEPFDTTSPAITTVSVNPMEPDKNDEITISATVTDDFVVDRVTLYYSVNQEEAEVVTMSRDGSIFNAVIGKFNDNDHINFYIKAEDPSKNIAQSDHFTFLIQDITPPVIQSYMNTTHYPEIYYGEEIYFSAHVQDEGVIANVSVIYRLNNDNWINRTMPHVEGTTSRYEYKLDPLPVGTNVDYYYIAYDIAGNRAQTGIMSFVTISYDQTVTSPTDTDEIIDTNPIDDERNPFPIPFTIIGIISVPFIAIIKRRKKLDPKY
jgi:parallel beta-helix repeat protein